RGPPAQGRPQLALARSEGEDTLVNVDVAGVVFDAVAQERDFEGVDAGGKGDPEGDGGVAGLRGEDDVRAVPGVGELGGGERRAPRPARAGGRGHGLEREA